MDFHLRPLPYGTDALEPHLSRATLELHHGRHHAGYLAKLEKLLEGRPEADADLESIVLGASGAVFDNAAQVWNHDFLWRSMTPKGGGKPEGALADGLDEAFGSLDGFRRAFVEAGAAQFGSGWVWLVCDDAGRLRVTATADADLPMRHGQVALLTADVWEHAYYLDYRNERERYLDAFLDHLVNWSFGAANWSAARARR